MFIRKFTILPLLFLLPILLHAQGVGINTDNSVADPSAMLDVKSTTKGMLVPRMTAAEKLAVATPVTGLLIYQTDGTTGFYYYNGVAWVPIAGSGGSGWDILGNTGTVSGTNFIGTTDAQNLDIRTNNVVRTRITQKGQIEVLNTGESVFIGEGAGANDDLSVNRNTFLGYQAGQANTTGPSNIAIGYQALFSNINWGQNMAVGNQSLYSLSAGDRNTAIGHSALYSLTDGGSNTAIGNYALYNHNGAFADYTTAIGAFALYSNTTGFYNTAVGASALQSNTTGGYNNALGNNALRNNTTGSYNIAFGNNALTNNTTGSSNLANGYQALYLNTTGGFNLANGYQALYFNTTGFGNIAIGGYRTLYSNTTGNLNLANGYLALYSNTTGNNNVANGYEAGYFNTTGSNNTFLGYNADATLDNLTNATAIGANTVVSQSNSLILGNAANVGIGTSTPTAKLDVVGTFKLADGTQAAGRILTSDASGNATWAVAGSGSGAFATTANVTSNTPGNQTIDNFVFGSPQLNDDGNVSHDKRMFFNKSFGAFRVGNVTGTQWDASNVGIGSAAMGQNTTASGFYSFAMGQDVFASGDYSVALGAAAYATGAASLAMGWNTTASGSASFAIGNYTEAPSFGETTIGTYSASYVPNNPNGFDAADRLFTVANGTGNSTRSNALVILKNANVGIGTSTPTEKLDVAGTVKLGVNGTTVTNVIKTTVNNDVLSVAANAGRTVTFAVPNAALTSTVYISPAATLNNGLIIAWVRVSAVGTVQVRFHNVTAAAIDPVPMDFYITVIE